MRRTLALFVMTIMSMLLVACGPTIVTEYDSNGKITKTTEGGGAELANKDICTSGGFSAVKLEATGTSSGTILPDCFLGGGVFGIISSPKSSTRPIMGGSTTYSWLSSIWNSKAHSSEFRYIGSPNESPTDTAARLQALLAYQQGLISAEEANAAIAKLQAMAAKPQVSK
jgi:hypothetical protein